MGFLLVQWQANQPTAEASGIVLWRVQATQPAGERGRAAFLGLCLLMQFGPAYAVWANLPRGLGEFQHIRAVLLSP